MLTSPRHRARCMRHEGRAGIVVLMSCCLVRLNNGGLDPPDEVALSLSACAQRSICRCATPASRLDPLTFIDDKLARSKALFFCCNQRNIHHRSNFDFGQFRLRPAFFFFFEFGLFGLRPISTSANFDFGQFRLRPISTSANFWMLNFGTTKGGGPEGWRPKPRKSGAPKGGAEGGAPKGGAPKGGGGPKISGFFFPFSRHNFHSSLPLLGVLSWNFGGV